MTSRLTILALLVASSLSAATPALAQSTGDQAAAEQLFQDARKLVEAKNYADACPKFADSQRLDPSPGTLMNLADCYEKLGRTASAWVTFKLAGTLARERGRADLDTSAREHASQLEPTLSKITIVVPAASDLPGLEVRRDATRVDRAEWGVPIPVDPGPHTIDAAAPGRATSTQTATVDAGGATSTITIPLLDPTPSTPSPTPMPTPSPSPAPSPMPAPAPTPDATPRTIAFVLGGAGVVAIAVGTYFGLHAKSLDNDALDNHCRTDSLCDPQGVSLGQDAHSAATVSTVLFAGGLAALAGGVVLYLVAPPRSSGSSAGTLGVGVASVSRGSLDLTLGGAW